MIADPRTEAPEKPPREFSFAKRFLLFSLLLVGGSTMLLTWFTVREVSEELTETTVEHAAEVVQNVFHDVVEEFLAPRLAAGKTYDHTDPEDVAALGEVVDRAVYYHHVKKLYFFDMQGLIVYSTQREHIGLQVPPDNTNFLQAAGGRVSWTLKRRNDPLDLTGDPAAEELLETYVPVQATVSADRKADGKVAGVIELYQEIKELRRDVRKSRQRIVTVALFGVGTLLVVFMYFIVRADRVIRQRRRQLMRSNQALQNLSRNLEVLVENRTQQLIEKQKLASLGGLAAGIAHEINTPLATIAACSEGSLGRLEELRGKDGSTWEDVRSDLQLIHTETFHCKEILRSLLDYSHQSPIAEASPLDLDGIVEQTLVLLRLGKESQGVPIELDLDADSHGLVGDPAQIRQVIHNLVENALHAVRDVPEPRIILRTRSDAKQVMFECEDNGAGIPEGIRAKVFEPFFTTKPSREGVGLGLALSFNIIQRHGGLLELVRTRTGPGGSDGSGFPGTLFRFHLYRSPARTSSVVP